MIIRNEEFLFESIRRMANDYFLFFEVTETDHLFRKGEVMKIINNLSFGKNEKGYYVNNVYIKNLGNVVGMFDKCLFPKTPNFSDERPVTNECPLSTQDFKKLIDDNYVAVEFLDGSIGWVSQYTNDYYTQGEQIVLHITFGDDSFETCLSSNVKKILNTIRKTKPKKIIGDK